MPSKVPVIGVGISATSYSEVVERCRQWIADRPSNPPARMICVTSVHGVMMAVSDRSVRSILNSADIATPDGMPIVWALRSFHVRDQQRVYGPELMLRLCESAAEHGHRIFLYGGRDSTLALLRSNLEARFPDIRICGAFSPPFRPLTQQEDDEVSAMIRESGADIVFVGISTPKQERWMAGQRDRLPGIVMLGVGAAFDFHAGTVRQAPRWMQSNGLEWLFRLYTEPVRLWKRYLLVTPLFLPLWALQKAGVLRLTLPDDRRT
jgi:N-acetylglucosaminyldiphosphoundecaprenol N-acetyl-beta-D-mannosaminyltransferase